MEGAVQQEEEKGFIVEEVDHIIKEVVEGTIQNQSYHHNKVAQWNGNIVEQVLKKLSSLNKPFKYIVTCVIMQKNGAGLHAASSCYWDNTSDGWSYQWSLGCTIKHPSPLDRNNFVSIR